MVLFWKIRYVDREDRKCKERFLILDTKALDAVSRAAIELIVESESTTTKRGIVRYRHFFVDGTPEDLLNNQRYDKLIGVSPTGYFEDETGKEITQNEALRILTGNPDVFAIPSGAKQHDIALMLAKPEPVPLIEISLTEEEVELFGYFARDLRELQNSAFMKDGPGRLKLPNSHIFSTDANCSIETAVTDEEIRSFVTIFRRLYMTGKHDRASFEKIVPIYAKVMGDHPFGKWVTGMADEYRDILKSVPTFSQMLPAGSCTFSTKRLIDVFLYTQYSHQPDSTRQRQFRECLEELNGKHAILTWMFLYELQVLSDQIVSAGRTIALWFMQYCEHHGKSANILQSLHDHHPGFGSVEKKKEREHRLFREKAVQLSIQIWEQAGSPDGGPSQYFDQASEQLRQIMNS